MTTTSLPDAIRAHLRRRGPVAPDVHAVGDTAFDLLGSGLLDLPLPGSGQTLLRWHALAEVAAHDLSVARLVEGHLEAEATLAEAGSMMADGLWGSWVATSSEARLTARLADGQWELSGAKRWCSGARSVTNALVTAKDETGMRLFALPVRQAGVRFDPNSWPAVGMALSDTLTMTAEGVQLPAGSEIGEPGWYAERPGYWAGSAMAAVSWYGGALGLVRALREAASHREADPFALGHLGEVDALCTGMEASLAVGAATIDGAGGPDAARTAAWQTRGAVKHLAAAVLERAAAALGSETLSYDGVLARRVADLTLVLQEHGGDGEYAALGSDVLDSGRRR